VTRYAILLALLVAAGCQGGGDVNVLGYSTCPPFDPDVKTVYVPVFKNAAFQTTPYRGLEVDLTQAVVRELGKRAGAPRVVSDPERADTELIGQLVLIQKRELNRNLQNLTREGEVTLTCNVVWRDLRTGRVLSNPRPPVVVKPDPLPFDPSLPPPPEPPVIENPVPVPVIASGRLLPEVGETSTTASKMAVDQIAKQIVNMMEKPW
jgi:hypothetical protein